MNRTIGAGIGGIASRQLSPVQDSPIKELAPLDQLAARLSELRAELEQLGSRLAPVLLPPEPQQAEEKLEIPHSSDLVSKVMQLAQVVERMHRDTQKLTDRIMLP